MMGTLGDAAEITKLGTKLSWSLWSFQWTPDEEGGAKVFSPCYRWRGLKSRSASIAIRCRDGGDWPPPRESQSGEEHSVIFATRVAGIGLWFVWRNSARGWGLLTCR